MPQSTDQRWPSCAKYIVVGMRGSGQDYSRGNPTGEMGPQLAAFYRELNDRPKFSGETTFMGVAAYKAAGVAFSEEYYRQVLREAGAALVQALDEVRMRCPLSKLIVTGYSQGAYAVRDALRTMEANPDRYRVVTARIAAAVVLADPGTPDHGILYFVNRLLDGPLLQTLADLLAIIQRYTGLRIPFLNEVIAATALAGEGPIAGAPKNVPFKSFDSSADLASRGNQLLGKFLPGWIKGVTRAAAQDGIIRDGSLRKQVDTIRGRVASWSAAHTSYGDESGVMRLMVDWTVMKSR